MTAYVQSKKYKRTKINHLNKQESLTLPVKRSTYNIQLYFSIAVIKD